jgi:hypothetical protein
VRENTTDPRKQANETALQRRLLELAAVLADVRQLDERGQAVFASIAQRAIVQSLGGPMVVDEAEDILKVAA